MPINIASLLSHAKAAGDDYDANPGKSVRGGRFVRHFQQHALEELRSLGLPPVPLSGRRAGAMTYQLRENGVVLGAYFPKELDVYLCGDSSGPLLGISFKTMMSGIAKNVNNRWEELVGDASNLHSRFPMLALGYVMVLPAVTNPKEGKSEEIVDAAGDPTPLGKQIAAKLLAIRGRRTSVELPTTYEEVALAVIDFSVRPTPRLIPTFPGGELRIETFYDRLVERFRERNHALE